MFVVLIIILTNIELYSAKISDKQYASMPLLFHQDNFDQCMLLEDDALYCSFTYELRPINPSNTSEIWNIISEVSSDEFNYRHDLIRHSICVPVTCPNILYKNEIQLREAISNCYNRKFFNLGLEGTVTTINCESNEDKYPVDLLDVIVAALFICYAVLIIYGTFYEGTARFKDKSEYQKITSSRWGKVITAFSIPRNWERLVSVKITKDTEKLRCLQGVRFYNTLLVILCHTTLGLVIGPVSNPKFVETVNDKIGNLFLSSGSLCVSTNFFMASFLLCYGLFSKFENQKEIKPKYLVLIFINRYMRLTPILFVMTMIHATWWRHVGRGPNWNNLVTKDFLRCRKNWWTNVLYVNNIINKEDMCLPHTWYLALDTQYFVVLILLITFMKKYPKLVWPILASSLCLNMVGTFIENYTHNFTALLIPTPESMYEMNNILPHPQWHYQTTSIIGCFAGPIVGLGYGYIFYKNKKRFENNKIFYEIMLYVIAFGGGFGIILIPGFLVMFLRLPHNIFWASLYNAISRPFFTLTVGYGLFSMIYGIGITRYVLEWSPLYVLGRLTYSAYLIHICVVTYRPAIARYPIYINDLSILLNLLGDLSATYLAALLLTLFFELPISELQKLLLPSKLEKETKSIKEE